MGVLLQSCCIFSEDLFLRTPLGGCLCITVITRMCHSIILIIAINCCHKKCLCAIYISKVTSSRQIHYDTRNLPPFAIVMCTVPKGIVPNIFKDVFSPKIANYSFCYQSEIRWSLLDGHYGNSLFGSMNTKNFCQTWHSSNCHCKQCENYGDDSGSIWIMIFCRSRHTCCKCKKFLNILNPLLYILQSSILSAVCSLLLESTRILPAVLFFSDINDKQ